MRSLLTSVSNILRFFRASEGLSRAGQLVLALVLCLGLFFCGGGGGSSNAAPVVTSPAIVTPPANQTVTVGQVATFSVVASGTAPLSYQWKKAGTNITGATSVSFATSTTTISDNGSTFSVTVSNTAGNVTSSAATLTVNPTTLSITTQPTSQTVTVGQSANFTVVASGGTLPYSYQWKKGSTNVGTNAGSYSITSAQLTDAGSYSVVITDSSPTPQNLTSSVVTLTVNPTTLSITTQPTSQTVTVGQSANFTVMASGGTLPYSYQWKKGTTNVGTNASAYSLAIAQLSDAGSYTVVVTDSSPTPQNQTSSAASLTVNPVPLSISTQPANQTVTAGQAASFAVVVSGGTTPYSYQWKNGTTNIGTNASTYSIASAQSSDAGSYSVVVMDSSPTPQSQISSAANLTVNPAQVVVAIAPNAANLILQPGASQQFAAGVSGTTDQRVTWSLGGAGLGTISPTGFYSAPVLPVTTNQPVFISATSVADPSAEATIAVQLVPDASVALRLSSNALSDLAIVGSPFTISPAVVPSSVQVQIQAYAVRPVGVGTALPSVDTNGVISWTPDVSQLGLRTLTLDVQVSTGGQASFNFPVEVVQLEKIIQGSCGPEGGAFADADGDYIVSIPPGSMASGFVTIDINVDRIVRSDGNAIYLPRFTGLRDGSGAKIQRKAVIRNTTVVGQAMAMAEKSLKALNATQANAISVMASLSQIASWGGWSNGKEYIQQELNFGRNGSKQYYRFQNEVEAARTNPFVGKFEATEIAQLHLMPRGFAPNKVQPVLFVHGFLPDFLGWNGGDGTWGYAGDLVQAIGNLAGIGLDVQVYEFRWRTSARFEDQAYNLKLAIDRVIADTGQAPIVVAHSFGGVLVLTYLLDQAENVSGASPWKVPYVQNTIKALITIGSPIGGIAWDPDLIAQVQQLNTDHNVSWKLRNGRASADNTMGHADQLSATEAGGAAIGSSTFVQDGAILATDLPEQKRSVDVFHFYAEPRGSIIGEPPGISWTDG